MNRSQRPGIETVLRVIKAISAFYSGPSGQTDPIILIYQEYYLRREPKERRDSWDYHQKYHEYGGLRTKTQKMMLLDSIYNSIDNAKIKKK
jgi:hypothetical protein